MGPNYPLLVAGGIVIVAGILIVVFRARLVAAMAHAHDNTIRRLGRKPEDHQPLTPLTNGWAFLWGVAMSCAGILMILDGLFRWW